MSNKTVTLSFDVNPEEAKLWLEEVEASTENCTTDEDYCELYIKCVVDSNSQFDNVQAGTLNSTSECDLQDFITNKITQWVNEEMEENSDDADAPERSTRIMETTEGFLENLRGHLIQNVK